MFITPDDCKGFVYSFRLKKKRTNRGSYKNVNILRLSHLSFLQWSAEDV